MTRASISSLVGTDKGRSLLWIHICLLFWVTLSWMATLLWICSGAFQLRKTRIELLSKRLADNTTSYHPHPHPQYRFTDVPTLERNHPNRGLRLRTVMVSNIPLALRNEKDLKEYFEFYMSRKLRKPSMGITSTSQPGFLNKSFAFLFNRAKRIPAHLPPIPLLPHRNGTRDSKRKSQPDPATSQNAMQSADDAPVIERVVIARKMTSIASLLERREEILLLLETAHIKLAKKTLVAVKEATERRRANLPMTSGQNRAIEIARKRRAADPEHGAQAELDEEARTDQLIEILGPFVEEFTIQESLSVRSKKILGGPSKHAFRKLRVQSSVDSVNIDTRTTGITPSVAPASGLKTIWEALHSLPRHSLDPYQPLVNLSYLFRGKTVPAIDYYTAKLNILTSLVTEARSKAVNDYDPVSTAFVTFANAVDARRACKYLAVHPNNPLACMVTMAPMYQDLDWARVMKSSFNVEVRWNSISCAHSTK
ncbi:hypothetical protein H0H87_008717 [Tephrocybe sp. NHM501043]|nr:hypothetical protein H0H87_008717 [Tephrocybe sp. NHM501043]